MKRLDTLLSGFTVLESFMLGFIMVTVIVMVLILSGLI
jgi:hypothetical protein